MIVFVWLMGWMSNKSLKNLGPCNVQTTMFYSSLTLYYSLIKLSLSEFSQGNFSLCYIKQQ